MRTSALQREVTFFISIRGYLAWALHMLSVYHPRAYFLPTAGKFLRSFVIINVRWLDEISATTSPANFCRATLQILTSIIPQSWSTIYVRMFRAQFSFRYGLAKNAWHFMNHLLLGDAFANENVINTIVVLHLSWTLFCLFFSVPKDCVWKNVCVAKSTIKNSCPQTDFIFVFAFRND